MTGQSVVTKKKREFAKKAGDRMKYNLYHINNKIFDVHEKHNYDAKKVHAPYAMNLEYTPWLKDKLINFESCFEIHECEKINILPFLLPQKSLIGCWNVKLKVRNDCHDQKSRLTPRSKVKVNCHDQMLRSNVKVKSQGQLAQSNAKVKCQLQMTGQRQHSMEAKVMSLIYLRF